MSIQMPGGLTHWLFEGNAPGYFGLVSAVVAAMIAWRSSSASRRSAEAAYRQLSRLEEQDIKGQADRFAAWQIECRSLKTKFGRDNGFPSEVHELILGLGNTSGLPIYNARVYVRNKHINIKIAEFPVVPPGSSPHRWKIDIATPPIKPGVVYEDWEEGAMSIETTFSDVRGVCWHRTSRGALAVIDSRRLAKLDADASVGTEEVRREIDVSGTSIFLFERRRVYSD
jgi:hypothetical protein